MSVAWDVARARAWGGARSVLTAQGVRGTALEVVWSAAHLALYPLGLIEDRTRPVLDRVTFGDLPPARRGMVVANIEGVGTPVVLVHGMVDNRSIFTLLRRSLRRRGYERVVSLNYSLLSHDLRKVAAALADDVERICEETGFDRVHLIGHSLGGLIARYYVQRMGGDVRVDTLVTLGTPHSGTDTARLLPHPLLRQMRPGSDVIAELAQPAPACSTRIVAIWSDLDQMVVPKSNGRVEHPDLDAHNIFIGGVGHMSMPIDGRVVHQVAATLARLSPAAAEPAEPAMAKKA